MYPYAHERAREFVFVCVFMRIQIIVLRALGTVRSNILFHSYKNIGLTPRKAFIFPVKEDEFSVNHPSANKKRKIFWSYIYMCVCAHKYPSEY